mgnify:CR=1 FL=1
MKIRSVFLVAGLLGFSAVASASSFVGTTNALGSSLANTAQASDMQLAEAILAL